MSRRATIPHHQSWLWDNIKKDEPEHVEPRSSLMDYWRVVDSSTKLVKARGLTTGQAQRFAASLERRLGGVMVVERDK